jgi:hypothetical protein
VYRRNMTTPNDRMNPPVATPSATSESAASEQVVPVAPTPPDLESRVNARRQELLANLAELKDDQSAAAAAVRERIRTRLSELRHIMKESVIHGWANITDVARARVGRWLAR